MGDWVQTLLGKKYSPDQPRDPAGVPTGGRWTGTGGGTARYVSRNPSDPFSSDGWAAKPGDKMPAEVWEDARNNPKVAAYDPATGNVYVGGHLEHSAMLADLEPSLAAGDSYDKTYRFMISDSSWPGSAPQPMVKSNASRMGLGDSWQTTDPDEAAGLNDAAMRHWAAVCQALIDRGFPSNMSQTLSLIPRGVGGRQPFVFGTLEDGTGYKSVSDGVLGDE